MSAKRHKTPLEKWMNDNGVKDDPFSKQIGVARSYITQLRRGTRDKPSLPVAVKIEEATDGAVPVETWLNPLQQGAAL